MSETKQSLINQDQVKLIFEKAVPLVATMGVVCERLEFGSNLLRMPPGELWVRPVNLFAGPTIMTLADIGMYIGVLSMIGPEPMAVTTSLNVNFLSGAKGGDLMAETKIIKCGKRLAYGEVLFHMSENPQKTVAHVTSTYALPATPSGIHIS